MSIRAGSASGGVKFLNTTPTGPRLEARPRPPTLPGIPALPEQRPWPAPRRPDQTGPVISRRKIPHEHTMKPTVTLKCTLTGGKSGT